MRRAPTRHYVKHKEAARALVHARLAHWASIYNLTYKRVAIRNTRSRWGSCSKAGNLNFSYKLILLPLHLADYVIVHELCHLVEFNHSPRFWALVARTLPDYKARKSEIHRYFIDLV